MFTKYVKYFLIGVLPFIMGCVDVGADLPSAWDLRHQINQTASIAVQNKDPKVCKELPNEREYRLDRRFTGVYYMRDECLEQYSWDTLDVDVCYLLPKKRAINRNGADEGITSQADCFYHIAEKKSDPIICDKNTNNNERILCKANATLEVKYCRELKNYTNDKDRYTKENCIKTLASRTGRFDICLMINNKEEYGERWQNRRSECVYQEIMGRQNFNKDYDPAVCNFISETDSSWWNSKAACFVYISKKMNNPEICNQANTFNDKIICQAQVAGDANLCRNLKEPKADSWVKANCISSIAQDKKDLRVCLLINSAVDYGVSWEEKRSDCLRDTLSRKDDYYVEGLPETDRWICNYFSDTYKHDFEWMGCKSSLGI